MKTLTLTKRSRSKALYYMSHIEMKGSGSFSWNKIVRDGPDKRNYKIPNDPYLEKIMSFNTLICYKCMNPIQVDETYTYLTSRRRITKYYHKTCFDNMMY